VKRRKSIIILRIFLSFLSFEIIDPFPIPSACFLSLRGGSVGFHRLTPPFLKRLSSMSFRSAYSALFFRPHTNLLIKPLSVVSAPRLFGSMQEWCHACPAFFCPSPGSCLPWFSFVTDSFAPDSFLSLFQLQGAEFPGPKHFL